jgi:glycosyltransferase involved in cell wall biosynthesis
VHRRVGAYEPVQVFICPSRFLAAKLAQGGVYPDRLELLGSFVDTHEVPPKAQPGGGIVYAGRLSHEKGVDVLVEAVARLGDGQLDVVGDGPERTRLEALAATRAPGRVRFHGRVPRERVLQLLRAGAVAAMPSRCHDNQPMAVLEAFACGVPVVATSLGGLPELVDGGCGEVVPPEDPDAMATVLGRLLAHPARALAMGQAARSRAEQEFTPGRHLAGLDRLYERAERSLAA